MAEYVYINGARLTAWMAYILGVLSNDLYRTFGVWLVITSAIRTYAEQERIFRERYVTAGNINGRRVYDTRVWNGVRWYRISSAGTVAVPGTSNHEIQGTKAAVDLADTGRDGGVATAGSVRSNWLRARAHLYGMVASGFGFGEAWHYDILNIFQTPPSSGAGNVTPTPKEDDMTVAILLNGRHYYTAGEEFLSHNGSKGQADITRQVNSAQDELHKLTTAQFYDYLDGMGIPRSVVDVNGGGVLNPQSGKIEGNGVWSRRREAVALAEQYAASLAEFVKRNDAAMAALSKAVAALPKAPAS
ncbi:lysin A [Microbacterium phage Quhwah]|uniref:Lysin A n=4 Tax=Caudoviricetes TaxID=2731619 RepID=A0A2Z4QA25_9CAUD|nr:lysin A [Microbacterium phage Quhwah]QDF19057.1 lysin A [Microbacterium phage Busephilis]QGH76581.1 lysin A [Microbacterium phage Antares]QXN74835.1 lysin A [Microbacterium phage Phrancesco]UQT01876.1 endolysin [Microbacterium phage Savannah]UVK58616.1 endolysin [Microbacterium phage CrazyRich]WNM67747.1 endolysin [Microbacterium phage LittleFortune]